MAIRQAREHIEKLLLPPVADWDGPLLVAVLSQELPWLTPPQRLLIRSDGLLIVPRVLSGLPRLRVTHKFLEVDEAIGFGLEAIPLAMGLDEARRLPSTEPGFEQAAQFRHAIFEGSLRSRRLGLRPEPLDQLVVLEDPAGLAR
jgi:hypothetical protein